MTIKLLLLKSGEDMIADISEMAYGEDDERRVVGYYLNKPCVIKMRDPNTLDDMSEGRGEKLVLKYLCSHGFHCLLMKTFQSQPIGW